MLVIGASIIFLILLFIPFIPGVIELRRPRDAAPLFIDMEHTKDPRYFGKSFRSVMNKYVQSYPLRQGIRDIPLSQTEEVLISGSCSVPAGKQVNHILCIAGDLTSEGNVYFQKEIYATGDVVTGSSNVLKAIASDGRIRLDSHTRVLRWVDADQEIEVGEGSHLGISLSCGGELRIAQDCTFQRLFGFPILTGFTDHPDIHKDHAPEHEISGGQDSPRNISTIPRGSRIEKDLIVKNDLRIEDNCLISGNIKTYSGLVIGAHVTVNGNIFSEEDITIGEHAVIDGNIFSQGRVIIQGNAQIGKKGQMKSIIGKSGVDLGPNICVYGYIMTEAAGMTR